MNQALERVAVTKAGKATVTVMCGLPDMNMTADRWREGILPAIERSNYRELLPHRGAGSRGGCVESLQFSNRRVRSGGEGYVRFALTVPGDRLGQAVDRIAKIRW